MNFGALGFVIGHEITHGFDDVGRQFDEDGNNINWWDDETNKRFKNKAKCMIDHYTNLSISQVIEEKNLKVIGNEHWINMVKVNC